MKKDGKNLQLFPSKEISRCPVFEGARLPQIPAGKTLEISLMEISENVRKIDEFEISAETKIFRGIINGTQLACISEDKKISGCLFGRLALSVSKIAGSAQALGILRVRTCEDESAVLPLMQGAHGIFPVRFWGDVERATVTLEMWHDERTFEEISVFKIASVGESAKTNSKIFGCEVEILAAFTNQF
jgi:hypothetical protein